MVSVYWFVVFGASLKDIRVIVHHDLQAKASNILKKIAAQPGPQHLLPRFDERGCLDKQVEDTLHFLHHGAGQLKRNRISACVAAS